MEQRKNLNNLTEQEYKAIKELYVSISNKDDWEDVAENDLEYNYTAIMTDNKNRKFIDYYYDNGQTETHVAIYVDTLELLTDEELEDNFPGGEVNED